MLKPGFLIQVLPIAAIVLAVFIFIVLKLLARLKPRDDDGSPQAWLAAAATHSPAAGGGSGVLRGPFPVAVTSDQGEFMAEAKDVSLAGAFIVCDRPLGVGTLLEMSLELAEPLALRATVTWNNSNVPEEEVIARGMRVRFLDISPEARLALSPQPPTS